MKHKHPLEFNLLELPVVDDALNKHAVKMMISMPLDALVDGFEYRHKDDTTYCLIRSEEPAPTDPEATSGPEKLLVYIRARAGATMLKNLAFFQLLTISNETWRVYGPLPEGSR